ncbi:hypothetical protein [Staphylococcus capitis]|nr:hypothetical protein [Staphylococcus capitis]
MFALIVVIVDVLNEVVSVDLGDYDGHRKFEGFEIWIEFDLIV